MPTPPCYYSSSKRWSPTSRTNALGVLPEHFREWQLEERAIETHICKRLPANWKAAQEAFKASDDLEARFAAEQQLEEAAKLVASANKIERAPTGLRTYWEAEVTDRGAALRHYIARLPEEFEALIQTLADRDARSTRAPVPGVTFHERKRAA